MKKFKLILFFSILSFAISCGQQKRYLQYKVKEGETLRTIARDLDVKTKDLLRLNPDVGRKPEANTIIVIPNKKMNSDSSENEENTIIDKIENETKKEIDSLTGDVNNELEGLKKAFVIHEVKPKETIYGLKRFYNVTTEDLLLLNPELSEGLKIGQLIKIRPIEEGEEVENSRYEDVIEEDISLKVALMLPFRANQYDSIPSKEIFKKSKLANIVADFYLGTEIAIDSLRKQGVVIELNVFDTERKNTKIKTIISENDLEEHNVIIGPLYSEEVKLVAKKVNTPVVFPVYSTNQSKFSSSSIIKTSPEKNVFRDELVSYLKNNYTKGTVIIVGDGESNSNKQSSAIKSNLEVHDSISKVHILKPKKGYIAKERFLEILQPNVKNWVVMTTNDKVVVDDAINSLISLPDSTAIKVFTYDKGSAFDRIDNFKLAKIGFTYVSDQYINESSESTKSFNQKYYRKNNALPSFYATKGFDITYDILMRLASGKNINETFNDGASFRIESKFDYNKKLFGTSENNGVFIVQYNKDLTLSRLR